MLSVAYVDEEFAKHLPQLAARFGWDSYELPHWR